MPIGALLVGDGTTPAPICKAYVVSKAGVKLAELGNANVLPMEWELDGAGSVPIQLHVEDPDALNVVPKESEIQVWYEGVPRFWGFVDRVEADKDTVTFQVPGLLRYFDYRFFGKADRTNLLTNAQFESDLTGWTSSGAISSAAGSTTRRILGTKSAKLIPSAAGAEAYIYQNVTVTGTGVGTLLTLAGWFFLHDYTNGNAAFDSRGLYVEMVNGATSEAVDFYAIDDDTPRESWQRAEATIWVPPNATRTIVVRCYVPLGSIYWDALSLTKMESLSFYEVDQASIARHIVDYAQDNYVFTHGKSDLTISATTATCPLSGVVRDWAAQFAEHANIGDTLRQFNTLDNGFDHSIEITATTRTFHTYYPSKGTDLTGSVTIANADLAEGPFGWRFDGEQAVSSLIVIGDGDGPDREEGVAIDTSLFGSTTFEDVVVANEGTPIDQLDSLAAERLRALKNPTSVTCTVHEPTANLLGTVVVGDTIDLNIDHGYIQAIGDYRVVAMRFDPTSGALTFELNAA
jgi:hypothetical protein